VIVGLEILGLLGLLAYLHFEAEVRVSPDGGFYLLHPHIKPYVMRRAFTWAMRGREVPFWRIFSGICQALTAGIVYALGGAGAAALWLGLASTRTLTFFPVLTDQIGILVFTTAWALGGWPGIVLATLGALVNEKVPVFGAIALGNPIPLIGLAWNAYLHWQGEDPPPDAPKWILTPIPYFKKGLSELSWQNMLFPWGASIVGLLSINPLLVVAAYAQCVIALDRARLYQWIGPMVCVAAVGWIPPAWWPLVLLAHWVNPHRRVV
jgi:hypothetical protein